MTDTFARFPKDSSSETIIATYWSVVSASSGTISFPYGASLLADSFQDLEDAVVSKVTSGKPNFNAAVDGSGSRCVASLDSSGNYSISPAPVAYPVALVYRVTIAIANFDPTAQNVIEEDIERAGMGGGDVSSVNGFTGAVSLDTDDIAEGATNLYFTDGRAQTALASQLASKVDAGANLGSGAGVFKNISSTTANFRKLVAGSNVTITENTNDITIAASGGGGNSYMPSGW